MDFTSQKCILCVFTSSLVKPKLFCRTFALLKTACAESVLQQHYQSAKKNIMKRILDSKKIFNISEDKNLAELKVIYRNLIKEWHPDKFQEGDELLAVAEIRSKSIIEAYHFLVSIAPETHLQNAEIYNATTSTSGIDDFSYKGQALTVTFLDGSVYEYFGVPKNIYTKFVNTPVPARFARRHIFNSYVFRKVSRSTVEV